MDAKTIPWRDIYRDKVNQDMQRMVEVQSLELKARQYADPPQYPEALYGSLGEAYLSAKSPGLASEAFEKALTLTRNDLIALSGLVRAYTQMGEARKAEDAMARLLFVTGDADPKLEVVERAKATGARRRLATPRPARSTTICGLHLVGSA